MRTIFFRSLAFAVATLTVTSAAAGEERASRLLNSMAVGQLMARAEPADHVRLSDHFSALGDWHTAQINRHKSMSERFLGNASRNLPTGMSMHCNRLADLHAQSAMAARQLADHHETLSSAATATPPEHHALYEYFLTLATRHSADAKEHAALAQVYRGTRLAQVALHHDRLAVLARESAKEATAAAVMHKDLADIAR